VKKEDLKYLEQASGSGSETWLFKMNNINRTRGADYKTDLSELSPPVVKSLASLNPKSN